MRSQHKVTYVQNGPKSMNDSTKTRIYGFFCSTNTSHSDYLHYVPFLITWRSSYHAKYVYFFRCMFRNMAVNWVFSYLYGQPLQQNNNNKNKVRIMNRLNKRIFNIFWMIKSKFWFCLAHYWIFYRNDFRNCRSNDITIYIIRITLFIFFLHNMSPKYLITRISRHSRNIGPIMSFYWNEMTPHFDPCNVSRWNSKYCMHHDKLH